MLSKIDYALLAKQKLALLKLQDLCLRSDDPRLVLLADETEGIVNLIDGIQDVAVDTLKLPPSEVFPNLETPVYWARKCDECGKGMNSGYVVNGGEYYYCQDECLHKHISEKEFAERYEDSETYYTEWDDEDDFMFEEINNEVKEINHD